MVEKELESLQIRGCGKMPVEIVETVEIVENFKYLKKYTWVRSIVQDCIEICGGVVVLAPHPPKVKAICASPRSVTQTLDNLSRPTLGLGDQGDS